MSFMKQKKAPLSAAVLARAARVLGLQDVDDLTDEAIAVAFRAKCMMTHPDTAGADAPEGSGDGVNIAELKRARDVLREHLARQASADICHTCHGNGYVIRKAIAVTCAACAGSGER